MLFQDRYDAGRRLAGELNGLSGRKDLIVLGLPRGGVPVASEVARGLGCPLDVFTVRKLGAPGQEELALGAIAPGGVRVLNPEIVDALAISRPEIDVIAQREQRELERRERVYRGGRAAPRIDGKTVILVDDGLATGATMRAAVLAVRQLRAREIIVAVPVGARSSLEAMLNVADKVVCPEIPPNFFGVGQWYFDFTPTTDDEVQDLLKGAAVRDEMQDGLSISGDGHFVTIPVGEDSVEAELMKPAGAMGLVIFAHGSGSSRFSPRNISVARDLNRAGFATLLLDLLTKREAAYDEASGGELRFSIGFLSERLIQASQWARAQPDLRELRTGYFGASTGAAAALVAAGRDPKNICAVVSRGGRPDMAGSMLARVKAPTLLIVGERDYGVIELNQVALTQLKCEKSMVLVPGATHLFEETGALKHVSQLASDWFTTHLAVPARIRRSV
ncbi:MAG TPA: phosphoribosyltransferase family protein [Bdellovibrionales bacterium]|nr:phosphoribosyltransferase family protein [Bdellovibrionales bacterium]